MIREQLNDPPTMLQIYMEARIPVRPHLRKFLAKVERLPANASLALTSGSAISYFMNFLFCNKSEIIEAEQRYHTKRTAEQLDKSFSDTISVQISVNLQVHNRIFISSDSIVALDRFLDKMMKERLMDRVERRPENMTEKDCILAFMDEYGMTEDDISFDALKKAVQRVREKDKKAVFDLQSSPSFPRAKKPA